MRSAQPYRGDASARIRSPTLLSIGCNKLRSEELVARRADIARVADPDEALRQWMRTLEDYFSAFSCLPEPLLASAREREPENPLTLPCDTLIATTDAYLKAAQREGHARASVRGYDLFLAASSVAWLRGTAAVDEASLTALRTLLETGYSSGGTDPLLWTYLVSRLPEATRSPLLVRHPRSGLGGNEVQDCRVEVNPKPTDKAR